VAKATTRSVVALLGPGVVAVTLDDLVDGGDEDDMVPFGGSGGDVQGEGGGVSCR